ncbi:MAG: hypothetical protein RLW61_20850 [Gammaproteobacteria bacterium]
MTTRKKGFDTVLALAFLCLGIAFAALAFGGSGATLTFALAAVTNLCAAIVFFLRQRGDQGPD